MPLEDAAQQQWADILIAVITAVIFVSLTTVAATGIAQMSGSAA